MSCITHVSYNVHTSKPYSAADTIIESITRWQYYFAERLVSHSLDGSTAALIVDVPTLPGSSMPLQIKCAKYIHIIFMISTEEITIGQNN